MGIAKKKIESMGQQSKWQSWEHTMPCSWVGVGVGPGMGNTAGREDSKIREISTKGKWRHTQEAGGEQEY